MTAYWLEIIVVALGLGLLMLEAFAGKLDKRMIAKIAIVGLGIVFVMNLFASGATDANRDQEVWRFYTMDPAARFYKAVALLTTIIVLIMSLDFTKVVQTYTSGTQSQAGLGEFFCLPIFACAGLMWMASATNLVSIFVALELVTITFYILVTYLRRNVGSLEAGVKYLILGALSTGFFVYGITWIFGITGETSLPAISALVADPASLAILQESKTALLFGLALIIVALGFKVAAVPFQIWVPDVYQGAPAPVTAFLSVGSKAAGFIVLMRILNPFMGIEGVADKITLLILILAGASLLVGNLAAIAQENFKRLLAYSSISHAGFLLLGVASVQQGDLDTVPYISYYLAGYLVMTMLCFLILSVVRSQLDAEDLGIYDGLGKRSPFLALMLLIALLSLAGIPLTAGFLGKFFIFDLAVRSGHFVVLILAVIGVAAGFYYYLKVIKAMYLNEPSDDREINVSMLTKGTIIVLAALIFILGVFPQPVLGMFGQSGSPEVAKVAGE